MAVTAATEKQAVMVARAARAGEHLHVAHLRDGLQLRRVPRTARRPLPLQLRNDLRVGLERGVGEAADPDDVVLDAGLDEVGEVVGPPDHLAREGRSDRKEGRLPA